MGDIYRSAQKCLIWLGEVPHCSHEMLLLEANERRPRDGADTHRMLEALDHVFWNARPLWWERALIVQEMSIPKQLDVCFGSFQVPWGDFCWDFLRIESGERTLREGAEKYPMHLQSSTDFPVRKSMRTDFRAWIRCEEHFPTSDGRLSLEDVAASMVKAECADRRDKVFSVLSLVDREEAQLFRPDYKKAWPQVFARATYASIVVQQHLAIWDLLGAEPAPRSQAPTWSLNFTKLLDSSLLRTIGQNGTDTPWKGWSGNISEQAVVKLSEDGKQLTVKGARFDTIEATALLRGRMFDAPKPALKAQLMAAIEAVPSRKPYSAFGTSSECPPMPEDLGSSQWRQDLEDFRQSKRAFDPYKGWAARSTLSKIHHIQDTLSEAFQLWWRAAGIPTEVTERVEYGMQFDIEKYAMYATAVIGDVDICTTASVFVALGPARSLEQGDVIALLAGAKFPVALGPNGSGGYHFRGLLYVHGIMYDELRACGLSEGLKEESFVLT